MSESPRGRGTMDVTEYAAQLGMPLNHMARDREAILDDDQLRSIRDTALRSAVGGSGDRGHFAPSGCEASDVARSVESLRALLMEVRETVRWSAWLLAGTVLGVGSVTWAAVLFLWR